MRGTIILLAVGAVLVFLLNRGCNQFTDDLGALDDTFKTRIGEQYILSSDTLIIVDYNLWESSFTLSNGVVIDSSLIIKD